MKYNCEIHNNGALPIPYVDKVGDQVAVGALYKDKPIFRDVISISGTLSRQINVHSVTVDTIFESSPDLDIIIKQTDETN